MKRNVIASSVVSALALLAASDARASAFALAEQGVSGLGNAYAGAAAVAEDASTVWWNPAGLSRLPAGKHVLLGGHVIIPSTEFNNRASTPTLGTNNGGDAGDTAFVPNFFYAMNLGPAWSFGLGVNVPFGLKTEYDPDWIGRFQGVESEVKTVNVNPSLAFKLSDRASIGFGVSYQYGKIDLVTAVPGAPAGTLNTVSVDGDSWGFNVGGLLDVTPATRVGVHYRSSLQYEMDGDTRFNNPALAGLAGNVRLDVETPATLSFSVAHRASDRLELLADATWTEWSTVDSLPLVRTSGPLAGATFSTLLFDFNDTWRFSLGAKYRWNGPWTFRVGVAFDESPVPNPETRSVRLPDNDRYWFSLGATYQASKASRFDVGYTFINVKDADINNTQPGVGTVNGTYEATVNILSIQYQHTF